MASELALNQEAVAPTITHTITGPDRNHDGIPDALQQGLPAGQMWNGYM